MGQITIHFCDDVVVVSHRLPLLLSGSFASVQHIVQPTQG